MNLDEIKQNVNLREYAYKYYGLVCNKDGKAKCPFHKPDKNPSFHINFKDDIWVWHDFHDSSGGTIVDFEVKFARVGEKTAIKQLLEKFGDHDHGQTHKEARPARESSSTEKVVGAEKPNKVISYFYHNENGEVILKKEKHVLQDGAKNFCWHHYINGAWHFKRGPYEPIPYNLDKFKDYQQVIVCEGEKDADTVNDLKIGEFATTAPNGAGSWPDEITQYFKDFKKITFLYDVGVEDIVEKHATKLKESFPEMEICIATVPMNNKNADITDYLDTCEDKQDALLKILANEEPVHLNTKTETNIFTNTLEELMLKEIPKVENLIKPYVFRGGLTEIGGVKGSHKSFFVANMAFHYASGVSPFLTATIEKLGTVLIIQQEISLGFNKERLTKMRLSGIFNTEGRLHPYTTTAQQLKLMETKDYDKLRKWIEKVEPDILILDPLATFHNSEENMSKDMSKIISRLSEIKATYNLGLVITHHFSSKRNPNDPNAPSEAAGWFRGSSTISDAADVLICLHRLPGQRDNPNLPKDYQDYNLVEIVLRNERNPNRFAIEFDDKTFFLKESTIWQEIGKLILPGQITDLLEDNNGEMLQSNVIECFKNKASRTTVKRAIEEAINQGLITKTSLEKKGKPALLKLRK